MVLSATCVLVLCLTSLFNEGWFHSLYISKWMICKTTWFDKRVEEGLGCWLSYRVEVSLVKLMHSSLQLTALALPLLEIADWFHSRALPRGSAGVVVHIVDPAPVIHSPLPAGRVGKDRKKSISLILEMSFKLKFNFRLISKTKTEATEIKIKEHDLTTEKWIHLLT